ncbi:amino acid transporter heavy chain SLC3A2 [Tribolium castaneum]|uniref:Maltase 1-like Protein n=1 Tax=Tribolium castaneum TaxID=7070 RepID=D6X352_TRICA|nr:PREDICTED: 4F2 cell-surface antigen heavy chain [Tribolium castaneum]EFA09799.1 Maltase 1-like Protein [Tribolium castaneum]|eukprot:XP_001811274.1 PREDICTED: 4F2 cell-surface antigen heavy chain [Tribolium castaneum]
MDGFLKVTNPDLTSSPSNSFIADEVASICPLITPSPPTNDLINPLPESNEPNYQIGEDLATILQQHVQDEDKCAGDSASSSSSALAEPSCTQLLNHRNSTYHHIAKDENTANEETAGKVQPLQLTFRNPPENYFFMSWNWPLIRKVSLGMFLSGLVAMVALVIMMISTLPKTCDPYTEWYQGKVFYEIFPASFYASDRNHMYGDFKGIALKSGYLKSLGVRAIRLNSIFQTPNYPDDYKNVTNLLEIAPQLGTIEDFDKMVTEYLKPKNISLILDLPVFPVLRQLNRRRIEANSTNQEPAVEFLKQEPDLMEQVLLHWTRHGVEGFYLKGLEHFIDDPHLGAALRRWKNILGPDRPLIISEGLINAAPKNTINLILNSVDLVDVRLEIEKGLSAVTKQIESVQNGTLFSRRGLPWVHWSLGDESLPTRLANLLPYGNATLGATLLQLMLPGTPCIFYGNEIGLQQISDPEGDRTDQKHLHHFTFMAWEERKPSQVLPWMHGERAVSDFGQAKSVADMVELRAKSPAIFYNSIFKEGESKANSEVIFSRENLLVIQRWYPRRKSYVVVSNLGNATITQDLSTLLYSGIVIIGPRTDSKSGSISFKDLSLWPGEAVVIELM